MQRIDALQLPKLPVLNWRPSMQFLSRIVSSIAGLFAPCPHLNTNFNGFEQKCWDCGRVRTFGATNDPGMWRREVLR